jgi:hypothetical protein
VSNLPGSVRQTPATQRRVDGIEDSQTMNIGNAAHGVQKLVVPVRVFQFMRFNGVRLSVDSVLTLRKTG